jgi:hypothetical protein
MLKIALSYCKRTLLTYVKIAREDSGTAGKLVLQKITAYTTVLWSNTPVESSYGSMRENGYN